MEIIAEKNIQLDNAEYILRAARHPKAGLMVLVGQPADTRLMPHATPGEFVRCADFAITAENTLGKGSGLSAQKADIRAAAAVFVTETFN